MKLVGSTRGGHHLSLCHHERTGTIFHCCIARTQKANCWNTLALIRMAARCCEACREAWHGLLSVDHIDVFPYNTHAHGAHTKLTHVQVLHGSGCATTAVATDAVPPPGGQGSQSFCAGGWRTYGVTRCTCIDKCRRRCGPG